jgi:hypothetical protein
MDTLVSMDIYTPKNAKIQTRTHKMEVSEKSEYEHLESHTRGRGFESPCPQDKGAVKLVYFIKPCQGFL